MINSGWKLAAVAVGMFAAGFAARGTMATDVAYAQGANRVFEMRTYTANPGKFDALKARFRDHTVKLFEKHGMNTTLVYILAYPSREAAKKSWAAFGADPDWQKARAESEKDGPILVSRPESVYLNPADFSAIK